MIVKSAVGRNTKQFITDENVLSLEHHGYLKTKLEHQIHEECTKIIIQLSILMTLSTKSEI